MSDYTRIKYKLRSTEGNALMVSITWLVHPVAFSLAEFNVQLKELMSVVIGLPMVVLSGIATHHTLLCRDDCKQLTASHRDHMNTLLAQQVLIIVG